MKLRRLALVEYCIPLRLAVFIISQIDRNQTLEVIILRNPMRGHHQSINNRHVKNASHCYCDLRNDLEKRKRMKQSTYFTDKNDKDTVQHRAFLIFSDFNTPTMPSPSRHQASPSAPSSDRHRRSRHDHSHSHRHRHRDGSRSRSPHRSHGHRSDRHHRRHDRHRDRHEHRSKEAPAQPVVLPLGARELSRRDLETHEPMFAMYLDIQKGILIEDLKEEELKGRWKSFVQKWFVEYLPFRGISY